MPAPRLVVGIGASAGGPEALGVDQALWGRPHQPPTTAAREPGSVVQAERLLLERRT